MSEGSEGSGANDPKLLHCAQCGAPYLDGVSICYECGAVIGEAEQPTQPVRLPQHLHARVAHLPAEMTPTVVLPAIPAPQRAAARTSPLLWPPRLRPLTLAALAIALALVVVGVVVLNQRLIPASVPLHRVYRDPAHRFHLIQPTLWQATPFAGGVVLSDSTGITNVLVSVADAPGAETDAMRADAIKASLGLQDAPNVEAGGTLWQQRVGLVTAPSGAQNEMAVYVATHATRSYVIECTAPAASFAADNRLIFQPLLASFVFD